LSRVIKTESAAKDRTQLTRAIVRAIQELMRQKEIDLKTHDLAAFIILAMEAISETVDSSVTAWEKRGYWLKADRFRLDWEWTDNLSRKMRKAILTDDWADVALTSAQVAEKLRSVELPKRPPAIEPWVGAWEKLNLVGSPKK